MFPYSPLQGITIDVLPSGDISIEVVKQEGGTRIVGRSRDFLPLISKSEFKDRDVLVVVDAGLRKSLVGMIIGDADEVHVPSSDGGMTIVYEAKEVKGTIRVLMRNPLGQIITHRFANPNQYDQYR